jgi:hypothetical protein
VSPVEVKSSKGDFMAVQASVSRGGMPCIEMVAFTLGLLAVSIAAPPPQE